MMEPLPKKVNYAGKDLLERYNNSSFHDANIDEIYSLFKRVKMA